MSREHINFQHTVDNLVNIIELGLEDGQTVRAIAEELVEHGYVKPSEPSRVWMYGKGQWDGSWVCLGGDEYGNRPLVIRLPGERALLVNLSPRLKRCYDDGTSDLLNDDQHDMIVRDGDIVFRRKDDDG